MTKEQKMVPDFFWRNHINALQLVAGAGSGKTTTLIETVLEAKRKGISPEDICLITFTRKAANEMKSRLKNKAIQVGFTGTMHSLGYMIIKKYYKKINKRPPKIIHETKSIIETIIQYQIKGFEHIPAKVLLNQKEIPPDLYKLIRKKFESFKLKNKIMDLDDLIIIAEKMLTEKKTEFPFKYVMIDEFQDTSPDQLNFILSMKAHKILAVGDDWQSIYAFRGADVSLALNFLNTFPGASRLFLTWNFRSQKNIVSLGNKSIKLSSSFIPKKLKANFRKEKKPQCIIASNSVDIKEVWLEFLKKYKDKKLTVLVRTNFIKNIIRPLLPENMEVLTIHSSKGMEFDNVLIFGIAKDIFPHKWNDYNEEVRLLYVAITRAKKTLYFLSMEENDIYSEFMPFLAKNCRISYLPEISRDQLQTG